jgi:hypothetical protein
MSLLDVLNKQQLLGRSTSFTQQAEQMKAALTGKEQAPESVQKTSVEEDIAKKQVVEEAQPVVQSIQAIQRKADLESQQIAQQRRQLTADYKQKENELISQVQRQSDQIFARVSEEYASLDVNRKVERLEQLSFLNNLADREYVAKMQIEGTKRRLDQESQWKQAAMYAAFEDQVDLLNEDINFKKLMEADDRTFKEMLAKIEPQAILESAIISYRSEQSAGAMRGIGEGIEKYGAKAYKGAVDWWNSEDTEVGVSGPGSGKIKEGDMKA